MHFPRNFATVLTTPVFQNADRRLLLKYLLKMKIAAPDTGYVISIGKETLKKKKERNRNTVSNRPESNI